MTDFPTQLQNVRNAMNALDAAVRALPGELPELFAEYDDMTIHPDLMAQLLMNCLEFDGHMSINAKQFWLYVADAMGPDHVEALRKCGAFMAKTGDF